LKQWIDRIYLRISVFLMRRWFDRLLVLDSGDIVCGLLFFVRGYEPDV